MSKSLLCSLCFLFILCLTISFQCGCDFNADSRLSGREALEGGWRQFNIGEYGNALKLFQQGVSSKDSAISLQGRYAMGITWGLRQGGADKEKAAEIFECIAAEFPKHDMAAWSLLALARQKQIVAPDKTPDYDDVRKAYQRLVDRFPSHPAADEAFIYQQATYLASLSKDDARTAIGNLKRFISDKNTSQFISPAWALIAKCHEILNEPEAQLDAIKKSLDTQIVDPNDPFVDNSGLYWNIATLAEFGTGDFATARSFYNRMMKEYPQDVRNFSARLALERMDKVEERMKKENMNIQYRTRNIQ